VRRDDSVAVRRVHRDHVHVVLAVQTLHQARPVRDQRVGDGDRLYPRVPPTCRPATSSLPCGVRLRFGDEARRRRRQRRQTATIHPLETLSMTSSFSMRCDLFSATTLPRRQAADPSLVVLGTRDGVGEALVVTVTSVDFPLAELDSDRCVSPGSRTPGSRKPT
jgi:hypothetical protein